MRNEAEAERSVSKLALITSKTFVANELVSLPGTNQ